MSKDEKYIAQAKAYERSKELRSDVATLQAELARNIKTMSQWSREIDHLLLIPFQPNEKVPKALSIVHDMQVVSPDLQSRVAGLLQELYDQSRELVELEDRIQKF